MQNIFKIIQPTRTLKPPSMHLLVHIPKQNEHSLVRDSLLGIRSSRDRETDPESRVPSIRHPEGRAW